MTPQEFFVALYGGGKVSDWCVLWRADSKASTFIQNSGAFASFAASSAAENFDAYFGVCLQGAKPEGGRGSIAGVSVVPGLWADIDFCDKPGLSDAAKKKNYPTKDAAWAALKAMPAKASLIVKTGGGIHAYWLFDQPFRIENDDERAKIGEVVKAWQGMLKAKLMKIGGFGLDSTFDLARVLRIPGSVHTKHEGVKVDVCEASLERYTLASVQGWLQHGVPVVPANAGQPAAPAVKKKPASAVLVVFATPESDPPGTKLVNLMEASPEFRQLWDGKTRRSSPSEYDMSLANYAINAGWTDQEAAALLVAFARKWNPAHIEKLLRVTGGVQDYLKLTIGKAHDRRLSDVAGQAADSAIDELAREVREAGREGRDPHRGVVLSKASQAFGVEVQGFRQTGRREEVYSLIVKQGGRPVEVIVGSAAAIHSSPVRLVERLMAECGRYIPVSKKLKSEWGCIVAGLISIREFHDLTELDLTSRVQTLIEEHLARKAGGFWVDSKETKTKLAQRGDPFIEKDQLFVCGPALKRLAGEIDRSIAGGDLYIGLRSSGFKQVTLTISGKNTSRSYWHGPAEGFSIAEAPVTAPLSETRASS